MGENMGLSRRFKRLLVALVVLVALLGFISPAVAKPVRPVAPWV